MQDLAWEDEQAEDEPTFGIQSEQANVLAGAKLSPAQQVAADAQLARAQAEASQRLHSSLKGAGVSSSAQAIDSAVAPVIYGSMLTDWRDYRSRALRW